MSSPEQLVGQYLLTQELGIGEITAISKIDQVGEDFFKVQFPDTSATSYYAVDAKQKYRIIADKKTILKAVDIFKAKEKKQKFASLQERLNFFKTALKDNDICELAGYLSQLHKKEGRHAQLNVPFQKALLSFVDEIQFVLKVSEEEAWNLIGAKAPKKK